MSASPPSWPRAVLAVLRKELRVLLLSPSGWVFVAAMLLVSGVLQIRAIGTYGEASLRPLLGDLAVALFFLLPWLTMRLLASETRDGSLELLLAAPVSPSAVVVGKWLSAVVVGGLWLLGLGAHVLVLLHLGHPDLMVAVTGLGGLFGVCALGCAAGTLTSSLSRDPVVAGVSGTLLLLPFWLVEGVSGGVSERWRPLVEAVAVQPHLRGLARGVVDTGDLAWFFLWTTAFLVLAWRALESRRWH